MLRLFVHGNAGPYADASVWMKTGDMDCEQIWARHDGMTAPEETTMDADVFVLVGHLEETKRLYARRHEELAVLVRRAQMPAPQAARELDAYRQQMKALRAAIDAKQLSLFDVEV